MRREAWRPADDVPLVDMEEGPGPDPFPPPKPTKPPKPSKPRRPRAPWPPNTGALAVGVAILLIAGSVALLRQHESADRSSLALRPPAKAPRGHSGSPTLEPQRRRLVEEVERFVSSERGLPFKHAVTVNWASEQEGAGELPPPLDDQERAQQRVVEGVFGALGLPLSTAPAAPSVGGPRGLYGTDSGEVTLWGDDNRPYVREILAHELTHALDDQWFRLARLDDTQGTDSYIAFDALQEGDAVRIEEAYRRSLPAPDAAAAAAEAARVGDADQASSQKDALIAFQNFPYTKGPPFASEVAKGGATRVDDAFRTPPTTSSQVLHPDRFLAGEKPTDIDVRPGATPVSAYDNLGEWKLFLMLRGPVGDDAAYAAAAAWRGDRMVAWEAGDSFCVRAKFAVRDGAASDALRNALGRWATARPNAHVSGTSPITIDSCVPKPPPAGP